MNTIVPDDPGNTGHTLLPSADTPQTEPDDDDTIPAPRPIPPLPGGTRVNPHGVTRSAGTIRTYGSAESKNEAGDKTSEPTADPAGPSGAGIGDGTVRRVGGPPAAASAASQSYSRPPQPATARPPTIVGVIGGALTLVAVILAAIAPFVPLLSVADRISLWGSPTGNTYAYVILGAAALGAVGAVLMLMSTAARMRGRWGGILSMVAGALVSGLAAYLVLNADHRAVIAQGGSFGAAAWLLIVAAGALLIGGILGLVRGSLTEGSP